MGQHQNTQRVKTNPTSINKQKAPASTSKSQHWHKELLSDVGVQYNVMARYSGSDSYGDLRSSYPPNTHPQYSYTKNRYFYYIGNGGENKTLVVVVEVQGENWIHPKHWHGSKEYLSWDRCGMLQKTWYNFSHLLILYKGHNDCKY